MRRNHHQLKVSYTLSMRGGTIGAIAAAVLIVAVPSNGSAASPIQPDPQQMILRLSDLAPGYRLGDEAECPSERGELDFGLEPGQGGSYAYCTIHFRDRRGTSLRTPRASDVHSGALTFRTAAEAAADYAIHHDLIQYVYGFVDGEPLRAPIALGDQATMYRGTSYDGHRTSLVWRSGRVNAFVATTAPTAAASEAATLALAQRQQERMLTPTPIGPRDNDEAWAFLNDPQLGFDLYWLGARFDPPGPLPARTLQDADYWSGPGWRARVSYGGVADLGIWTPRRWARFKRSKLGRYFLCDRCAERRQPRLEGRRTTLYAIRTSCLRPDGPATTRPAPSSRTAARRRDRRGGDGADQGIAFTNLPPCRRDRPPNLFVAVVRIRDTIVTVNLPFCFGCANTVRDPYRSFAGMRAIAKGLTLHAPKP